EIKYQLPLSDFSFQTAGNSKLNSIDFKQSEDSEHHKILHANLDLSGKITHLQISQKNLFSGKLSEASIKEGKIVVDAKLSADNPIQLEGLKYSLVTKVEKIKLDEARIGKISLGSSEVTDASISILHEQDFNLNTLPSIDISGNLKLNITSLSGSHETFNIPGFDLSGNIQSILIQGPAHLNWNSGNWFLKRPSSETNSKLKVSAHLDQIDLSHNPSIVKDNELKKWSNSHVVKTNASLKSADLLIEDVEKIEFKTSTETSGNSGLQNVSIHGISINKIDAGGIFWANFPLFYYLRGVFPKIGTLEKGPEMKPSFIKLGDFNIKPENNIPVITFEKFSTELYEIGGNDQFAKLNIPFLKIYSKGSTLVETGDEKISVDLKFLDKLRGGSFEFKSVPRPLEERKSRIEPASK
ncbi:MAG: hypothetical protein JNK65_03685, partial [Deltaproteobacteria bacterium]|nr:hypothetical protein [Deltaproteobacteria bacterium]